MRKYIILGIVITGLAMFAPHRALTSTIAGSGGVSTAPSSGTCPQRSVEDIMVSKIEDGTIYAKDGRSFNISGAKVIDNGHNTSRSRSAALIFQNGEVVAVILK